ILRETQTFKRHLTKLRNLYALSERLSKISEGDVPYPSPQTSTDGMAFELKDVIFDYPGSKNKSPALKNVSLHIKPGQLVVIVGANGSGKSSLIKLLTRLYDPSFGTLFIDGTPAHEYRPTDVRRTMASFTQDHNLFPLSLYENIAFGDVARSTDTAAVLAAVEQGGATELIAKFVDGLDTILNSQNRTHVINIPDDQDHPLQKYMKTLSKKTDVSGGEKQRLVAARTFMHLNSGRVNFVAVDEPSSALDPEAEFQMFNRLIANRPGKTMVFVTHRFGHLTKHADLILCMKDGAVAESGSHGELMKLDGEYAKLYQIQANAFSNSTQTVSSGANVD
ncbi:Lipid A export ATP-binding/permease protein MsbA, partial [Termitomyces sp. T112]